MNYATIIKASCVDFTNWSTIFQCSGCHFDCRGCFNKAAQNPRYGEPFTEEVYQELITAAGKPFISNIVLMGGEPLYFRHAEEMLKLCKRLRKELPDKNIVLFTGYTYEQLRNDLLRCEVLNHIDYLVDGKFVQELSKNPPPFRGSSNQVLHTIINGISVKQS